MRLKPVISSIGLLFAAVLVCFLMVVSGQNFGDPLVVILARPAVFGSILTMLFGNQHDPIAQRYERWERLSNVDRHD